MHYPYPVRVRSARPVLRAAERAPPSGGKVCFGKAFTAIISGWRRDAGHMRRGQPHVKGKCFIKKTANYQLNQWDPGDRILREEFNEDNARIDAAIEAANPLRSLSLTELAEDSGQLNLDLSAVDWSQYWEVRAYFELTGTENGTVTVLIDNMRTGYSNSLGNSAASLAGLALSTSCLQGCVRLYRQGITVGAVVEAAAPRAVITEGCYSGTAVQSLNFVFPHPLKAGSRAWLCGLKK